MSNKQYPFTPDVYEKQFHSLGTDQQETIYKKLLQLLPIGFPTAQFDEQFTKQLIHFDYEVGNPKNVAFSNLEEFKNFVKKLK